MQTVFEKDTKPVSCASDSDAPAWHRLRLPSAGQRLECVRAACRHVAARRMLLVLHFSRGVLIV